MSDDQKKDQVAPEAPALPANLDAQQLAATVPAEELATMKDAIKATAGNEVLTGRFLASCPGSKDIHVRADSRADAVKLVCLYLGCEPSEVVVSAVKKKAGPRRGDRVLRWHPVAGNPDAMGYAYGIEPVE